MFVPELPSIFLEQWCAGIHKQRAWAQSLNLRELQCKGRWDLYRVSQEEMSVFWEVTVSVILSKGVYMYMCPILNGFRDRGISLKSCKIVNKEIVRIVSYIGIYCPSDKVGSLPSTKHFWKFHCQHQCTLQLVWGHGVLLIWWHLDVPLCWW
jgi:hypothetical protein